MERGTSTSLSLDKDYEIFLRDIKDRLKSTQLRVASAVNTYVIQFYWQLGRDILHMQSVKEHWGSHFIGQLSQDLQATHPGLSGFSKRSLEYMRLLASSYPSFDEFTQQPAAQLPWSHIQLLLDKFN